MSATSPSERVPTPLLRGDNLLGSRSPKRPGRALRAFDEPREMAAGDAIDARVRELVERRMESVRRLIQAQRS